MIRVKSNKELWKKCTDSRPYATLSAVSNDLRREDEMTKRGVEEGRRREMRRFDTDA